ncbi:Imm58 family immunity protein [Pseudoalteromonas galatheae]|uniref:Imm58 family immunity protein n=1 Tax=Pseudoalteromonas galatheae TaxID=579562 RepID=UPI0038B69158
MFLIGSNTYWFFVFADQALTEKYQSMNLHHQDQLIADMGNLIVKGIEGKSKKDVLFLLRQAKPEAFLVDEGDVVTFENIAFKFEQDKLVAVGK